MMWKFRGSGPKHQIQVSRHRQCAAKVFCQEARFAKLQAALQSTTEFSMVSASMSPVLIQPFSGN